MSTPETFFGSSEEAIQQEFLKNLKIRSVEQKFLYFGQGVDLYYHSNSYSTPSLPDWQPEEMVESIKEIITKDERVGFISLGCGIALRDRDVMRLLEAEGYNFDLIGVDTSISMIEHARRLLSVETFRHELWTEDITSHEFYKRTRETMDRFDKLVFMFMGSTMGNMIQTEIVDTLYNIMLPGHILWFDCVVREAKNKMEDLEFFTTYAKRLTDQDELDFMFYPLQLHGVSQSSGIMVLENLIEESIGVLNFRYSFRFHEPCTIRFLDEYVHFIPPEKIKLLEIRVYHPDTMISYFEQHDFKLTKKKIKGIPHGQFLFKKI